MLMGTEEFTSQQPVLYTLMLNLVKAFSPDLYTGFAIFTLIQIILMISLTVYFLYWLLNKKVNPIIVYLITCFFAFFKLYPLYSVSIWKDTPFSLALFAYTLILVDLILEFKNKEIKIFTIIKLNIFSILITFLRNNGLYIVFFSVLILILTFIAKIIKEKNIANFKPFIISFCITIIISLIISKSFSMFGIENNATVESLAIPIQQIARVVAVDGNIIDEQKELIEKVLPIDNIKKDYRALLVDKVKWDDEFNEDYLEEHLSDYFKLWFELLIQNPTEFINSYLLQTSGFWTFNVKGEESYTSAVTWETLNDTILNKDLISENTNFSVRDDLLKFPYYSGGFFFWIMALSMFITFKYCKKTYLIGYLPEFILWATVMISTPMGQALRYVYLLVLLVPFNIIYPSIIEKKNKNNQKIESSESLFLS